MKEKTLNIRSIQKNSLINALELANEQNLDISQFLPQRSIEWINLLQAGKRYKDIAAAYEVTPQLVQRDLCGKNRSALSIIRRNLSNRVNKEIIPSSDEIISKVKELDATKLYEALARLKKPALRNLWQEIHRDSD